MFYGVMISPSTKEILGSNSPNNEFANNIMWHTYAILLLMTSHFS